MYNLLYWSYKENLKLGENERPQQTAITQKGLDVSFLNYTQIKYSILKWEVNGLKANSDFRRFKSN